MGVHSIWWWRFSNLYEYVLLIWLNFITIRLVVSCPQSKQEIHRRSARLRSTKYKAPASEKKVSTKGKGRRHIFKLKNVREKLYCSVYRLSLYSTVKFCTWLKCVLISFLSQLKHQNQLQQSSHQNLSFIRYVIGSPTNEKPKLLS